MVETSVGKEKISDARAILRGGIDYAAAVNASPSGIVVTDATRPDNPIVFVNPAFTELTGFSRAEAMGKNCRFLSGSGTDRETISQIGAAIARGRPVRKEILNYRRDGRPFWNDLAINPIMDRSGKISSFVGIQTDVTDKIQSRKTKDEAESRIARIIEHMPGYVFSRVLDRDGTVRYANPSFSLTDWDPNLPVDLGKYREQVMHPDDRDKVREAIVKSVADRAPLALEFRAVGLDGIQRWFRTSATPRNEANGAVVWDGVGIDITREKVSEKRLASIVDNMPGFVFQRVRRPDGTIEYPYLSPSFGRMVGEAVVQSTAAGIWNHMHPDDRERVRSIIERSAAEPSPLVIEYRLLAAKRDERWIRAYSSPRKESNGDVVWDGVAVDITNERASEVRLAYLAHHDPLTGLANRSLLMERLAAAIVSTREGSGEAALTKVRIVDFSEINETLGMDDGDSILKGVAFRMNELTVLDHCAVVARVGNSEFAILRQGRAVAAQTDAYVANLMRYIIRPIPIGDGAVAIETCAGTATLGRDELNHLSVDAAATEMWKRAAIAVSAAAKAGQGAHRLYDEELDHRTRHRLMLRHSMRHAIERDQFELHYQPIVDLRSGRIVSAEALIRWRHPELGMLRPDLFISLAEESGQMGVLGEWVMRRAMLQVNEWESTGLVAPKIAINVSGVQIGMPDFVASVRKTVAETGADPRRYELELTEGILMERSPRTLAVLSELRFLGFELAIDDFGTGHSSFQYLRNFPINTLKIDQIFVRQLVADSNDALIISAIASLARSLKLGLIAEGIETMEQREFLCDQGCPIGQGYFFSLPLAAEDFGWMIANEVALPIIPTESQIRRFETTLGQP